MTTSNQLASVGMLNIRRDVNDNYRLPLLNRIERKDNGMKIIVPNICFELGARTTSKSTRNEDDVRNWCWGNACRSYKARKVHLGDIVLPNLFLPIFDLDGIPANLLTKSVERKFMTWTSVSTSYRLFTDQASDIKDMAGFLKIEVSAADVWFEDEPIYVHPKDP